MLANLGPLRVDFVLGKYPKYFESWVLWVRWEIMLGDTILEPHQRLSLN